MAHEKVYGICENKCREEVYPKTETYSKDETYSKSEVNTAISTVNTKVGNVKQLLSHGETTINGFGSSTDMSPITINITVPTGTTDVMVTLKSASRADFNFLGASCTVSGTTGTLSVYSTVDSTSPTASNFVVEYFCFGKA